MTVLAPLPPDGGSYEVVLMLTPSRAVDLFLGDLGRHSRSKTGRTTTDYAYILDKFTDQLRRRKGDIDVSEITSDDCRAFLDLYKRHSVGYQHTIFSYLSSLFEWLDDQSRIKRNPLRVIPRPRRIASEDLDVVSISTADVPKLLAACQTDAQRICVAILAYMGPRRNAVAGLRLSDYDRDQGRLRFREKGSKVIWKPVPHELAAILNAAIRSGALENPWQPDDPYLIPPEGALIRTDDRNDRVIWRLVKRVAEEAGIEAHVHALRHAFAVHYLETHNFDIVGLQELLGHTKLETTKIYLRKLDKARAMEPVRTLSWGAAEADNMAEALLSQIAVEPFGSQSVVGAGGFEPPLVEASDERRAVTEPPRLASSERAEG